MSDEHIGDLVVEEMLRRRNLVKDLLRKKYKMVKPLRMEQVDNDTLLYTYNTKGYEIFAQKAEREGMESAIKYRDEMEALKRRRENAR